MKCRVQVLVIEGFSDAPTNRLSETVEWEAEFPAVPRVGDLIETGYGDQEVRHVFWSRTTATLRLDRIYTGRDSLDDVRAALAGPSEEPNER